MARFIALVVVLAAVACDGKADKAKPAGTPTDPVDVCERLADVCRLDDARLGVCVEAAPDSRPEECAGKTPCYVCQDQH